MGGEESSTKFLTRLSFVGLPQEAWEVEFVTNLVSSLGGDLVKMLKPTDRCFVVVEAWMKNPNKLPKLYEVELPEPELRQDDPTSDSDGPISPPSSQLTLEKRIVLHVVKIHILKVIDQSPIFIELPPAYDYDDESNSARCHTFSCYPGTIDGGREGIHWRWAWICRSRDRWPCRWSVQNVTSLLYPDLLLLYPICCGLSLVCTMQFI